MALQATLTDKRHIAAATAAYLASIPAEGDPPYASVEDYFQAQARNWADSWAETTGVDRIPVAAFVRRFGGAVMDACETRALTDPIVAAILAQLDAVQTVRLGHPTTTNGVGYLVSAGLMTQVEADAVLHYDIPTIP